MSGNKSTCSNEPKIVDLNAVRAEAIQQIKQEDFDKAVQAEMERLRSKRPWWHYLWPIEVTIKWRF